MKYTLLFLICFCSLFSWGQNPLPDEPKPRIFSKTFIAIHSALLASVIYDSEITHAGLAHHHCVEANVNPPFPSRGDLYKNGLLWAGVATGMDIGLKAATRIKGMPRWLNEVDGNLGAMVGTGIHLYGGTEWLGSCW